MLAGFHAIDEHFRRPPRSRRNLPVIQGLLNVWYNNFFGAETHAVLPYSQRLARFPAYLQQLTMESNGKSVRRDGSPVAGQTGEIFWGEPGHQRPARLLPADPPGHPADPGRLHRLRRLHPRARATSRTCSWPTASPRPRPWPSAGRPRRWRPRGRPPALVPHKVMPGNRPSSTILAPQLTPSVLGQLVALYEHTVFVEGAVWGIDSFDQWGVELGKVMAKELAPVLTASEAPDLAAQDSSTAALVRRYRALRHRAV